jgi:predicted RNA-binding protein with PIN domain
MSTRRWLIDGMNVIGSRPNRWWRDRRGAIQQFTERVAEFVALSGDSATIVFDGKPFSLRTEVDVVFARGRRNAADDAIVGIVSDDREPFAVTVVTSDRELARRVHDRGAVTLAASIFLRHLEDMTENSTARARLRGESATDGGPAGHSYHPSSRKRGSSMPK